MAPSPGRTLSPGRGHPSRPASRSFMGVLDSAPRRKLIPRNWGWVCGRCRGSPCQLDALPARLSLGQFAACASETGPSSTDRRPYALGQPSGRALKKKKAASGRRWMPPISFDRLREEERTDHIRNIVVMLRPHNSCAMLILHCGNADALTVCVKAKPFPARPGL